MQVLVSLDYLSTYTITPLCDVTPSLTQYLRHSNFTTKAHIEVKKIATPSINSTKRYSMQLLHYLVREG